LDGDKCKQHVPAQPSQSHPINNRFASVGNISLASKYLSPVYFCAPLSDLKRSHSATFFLAVYVTCMSYTPILLHCRYW
jgi:hypothetical protein